MANTIPAVADRKRSEFTRQVKEVLRASDLDGIPGLVNAALAECGTGTVISQEWADGQCSQNGAIPTQAGSEVPIATWIIPAVSNKHDTLDLEVRAYGTSAEHEARVIFRSRIEGDEVEAVLPTLTDTWTTVGSLGISSIEVAAGIGDDVPVEYIDMYLQSESPGAVLVRQVHGEINNLSSPLPAERIDAAVPIGTGRIAEGLPLTSKTGFDLILADEVLRTRPRLGLCWAGLNSLYTSPAAVDEVPPPHGILAVMRHLQDEDLQLQSARVGALQPHTIRAPDRRVWGISPPGIPGEGVVTVGILSRPGGVPGIWDVIPGNSREVYDTELIFSLSVWGAV